MFFNQIIFSTDGWCGSSSMATWLWFLCATSEYFLRGLTVNWRRIFLYLKYPGENKLFLTMKTEQGLEGGGMLSPSPGTSASGCWSWLRHFSSWFVILKTKLKIFSFLQIFFSPSLTTIPFKTYHQDCLLLIYISITSLSTILYKIGMNWESSTWLVQNDKNMLFSPINVIWGFMYLFSWICLLREISKHH